MTNHEPTALRHRGADGDDEFVLGVNQIGTPEGVQKRALPRTRRESRCRWRERSGIDFVTRRWDRTPTVIAQPELIVPRRALIERIRAEYLEMPGLRVTLKQASRLWGADAAHCQSALDALVDAGFLLPRHGGLYVRAAEGKLRLPSGLLAGRRSD